MNKNENEVNNLFEKINDTYKYDNDFIIGIPSEPSDILAENFAKFQKIKRDFKIEDKINDIVQKAGLQYIDEAEEKRNEEDNEEEEEGDEKDDIENRIINENIDWSKNGIKENKKNEGKVNINQKLNAIINEYNSIHKESYNYFFYYGKVISEYYFCYKRFYWKSGIGKIYDRVTSEIITLLNKIYLNYEKILLNLIVKLKDLDLKIRNNYY